MAVWIASLKKRFWTTRQTTFSIAKDVVDVLVPTFWIEADVAVRDTTLSTIRSTFVVLPQAILIAKIVTLAVSVSLATFATGCLIRQTLRRRQVTCQENHKIVDGDLKNSSSYWIWVYVKVFVRRERLSLCLGKCQKFRKQHSWKWAGYRWTTRLSKRSSPTSVPKFRWISQFIAVNWRSLGITRDVFVSVIFL